MSKPTPRVIELLGYVEKGWIMGCHFSSPSDWRSYSILTAGYGSGIRNPNDAEIAKLLSSGFCDEVLTPGNHDTYDTTNPKRPVLVGRGKKMILTPKGIECLRQSATTKPAK